MAPLTLISQKTQNAARIWIKPQKTSEEMELEQSVEIFPTDEAKVTAKSYEEIKQ